MIEFFPTSRAIVQIGQFTVYWYGLLYVLGFALACFVFQRLQKHRGLNLGKNELLELITWGAAGVIIGGRLGYVLLYEPTYYLAHPLEIFQLSAGGMSSHGGMIGVAVGVFLFAKVRAQKTLPQTGRNTHPASQDEPLADLLQQNFLSFPGLRILDIITIPASLGLALGRVGNVINSELYLTPLAQVVAIGAPLFIALVCYRHVRNISRPGTTTGWFLVLWSVARFGEEYLRAPEWPLVAEVITRGQLYTLPFLVVGLYLLKDAKDRSS